MGTKADLKSGKKSQSLGAIPLLGYIIVRSFFAIILLAGNAMPLLAQSGPCSAPTFSSLRDAIQTAELIPASFMPSESKAAFQKRFEAIRTESTAMQNGSHRLCAEKRGFDAEIALDDRRTNAWNQKKLTVEAEIERFNRQCTGRVLQDPELSSCNAWRSRLGAVQAEGIQERIRTQTLHDALRKKIESWEGRWLEAARKVDAQAKQLVADARKAEVDHVIREIDKVVAANKGRSVATGAKK